MKLTKESLIANLANGAVRESDGTGWAYGVTEAQAVADYVWPHFAALEAELAAARTGIPRPSHEGPCGPEAGCDASCMESAHYAENVATAARELGPCGLHPKMFNTFDGLIRDGKGNLHRCTLCDREKAAIAAALRQAADIVNRARGTSYDLRGIVASILALITPDQSAATAHK